MDALDAAPSQAERRRVCTRIERLVVEQAPWVFLWHRREYIVRQPWVNGWKMYPIYNANKLTDVFIRQSKERRGGLQRPNPAGALVKMNYALGRKALLPAGANCS